VCGLSVSVLFRVVCFVRSCEVKDYRALFVDRVVPNC